MVDFKTLKRRLRGDLTHLPTVRVALLGDTATQLLNTAICGEAVARGLRLQVLEADYNQVERQLLDDHSDLYRFDPEFVVLFQSTHRLAALHSALPVEQQATVAQQRLQLLEQCCGRLLQSGKKVICFNYPEIDDTVFGSYANKVPTSLTAQVRQLNCGLMDLANRHAGLMICDLAALQSKLGRDFMFAPNVYASTEMVLSIDALPWVASRVLDVLCAVRGQFNKCLILDLDNTLWGGIIGDDGIERIQLGHIGVGRVFSELQLWVKKLRQRGIIICVVSKNDEAIARLPFEQHPDMVLRMDDIAVFMANWQNKADNIRAIQQILNISFDAMVFIDDNPCERAIVRDNIPGITVPELPDDPAQYLEFLYGLNLFETASYSQADTDRTRQYQVEAQRVRLAHTFTDEAQFLQSLGMVATVQGFTAFNTPRVAQLSQRSNQFNLRTVRYTEADIACLAQSPDVMALTFGLSDRFGDNGLIAVVILKAQDADTLFIDTWIMSCRVLKRGMEDFILNTIVQRARQAGYKCIVGEYLPTAKNGLVQHLYTQLGFTPLCGGPTARFALDVAGYVTRQCFIQEK